MYSREEIREELEQFIRDYDDDKELNGIIIDYIVQVQDEANRQGYADRIETVIRAEAKDVPAPIDETDLVIKVHSAMACAHNDVLVKYIPEGDVDKFILKMTPFVVKYLLEDFRISEKE